MVTPPLTYNLRATSTGTYTRLFAMALLDAAVLAAVVPLLSIYMVHVQGLSARQMSSVFALGPIMALFMPLVTGQLADRHFAAERVLSVLNLLRAGALLLAGSTQGYAAFMAAMSLVFALQIAAMTIASSIAFHHLSDARRFGFVRVGGTVGWIITVWLVSFYLDLFPAAAQPGHTRDCFYLAAALSAAAGFYALSLPPTPPVHGSRRLAILEALPLFHNRRFFAIALGAFVMAMAMPFYIVLQGLYFIDEAGASISVAAANRASSLAQSLELLLFPFLSLALYRFGLRWVLFVGLVAWPLRFLAFMVGGPVWLVAGAQVLHGFNVVCWMASAVVAVDLSARPEVRASAQALYSALYAGVGALCGRWAAGLD